MQLAIKSKQRGIIRQHRKSHISKLVREQRNRVRPGQSPVFGRFQQHLGQMQTERQIQILAGHLRQLVSLSDSLTEDQIAYTLQHRSIGIIIRLACNPVTRQSALLLLQSFSVVHQWARDHLVVFLGVAPALVQSLSDQDPYLVSRTLGCFFQHPVKHNHLKSFLPLITLLVSTLEVASDPEAISNLLFSMQTSGIINFWNQLLRCGLTLEALFGYAKHPCAEVRGYTLRLLDHLSVSRVLASKQIKILALILRQLLEFKEGRVSVLIAVNNMYASGQSEILESLLEYGLQKSVVTCLSESREQAAEICIDILTNMFNMLEGKVTIQLLENLPLLQLLQRELREESHSLRLIKMMRLLRILLLLGQQLQNDDVKQRVLRSGLGTLIVQLQSHPCELVYKECQSLISQFFRST